MAQIEDVKADRLKDYEMELFHAMNTLKTNLAQCQHIMGVIESFLHLIRKESGFRNRLSKNLLRRSHLNNGSDIPNL